MGNIVGAITAILLWFGLAFAQWKTRGGWSLGIGVFSIVTLAVQSFLFYLAISSGRVAADLVVVLRFVCFSVVTHLVEAVCCWFLYATRSRAL